MSTIIVGYDGSDTARAAVDEAATLATALGRPLRVVWAIDERDTDSGALAAWADDLEDSLKDRNTAIAGEAASRLEALAAEVAGDVSVAARVGTPAEVLVAEATETSASMIVVGNRNTQGLRRLLGNVASDVLKTAPCSVYVADTTDAA